MRPNVAFLGNPVLSLQTMLRDISFEYEFIPRLIPDGIFGERTLEAVMMFQREFFPPVTGQVDNNTWDAIAVLYQQVKGHLAYPRLCTGYPCRSYTVSPGEQCVHLYLIQSMYKALSHILVDIEDTEVNGVMDGPSVRNTQFIQQLNEAEENGVMDKASWDTLCRMYTVFVTYAQTPWLSRPELFAPPGV